MKKCLKCPCEFEERFKFCPECGTATGASSESAMEHSIGERRTMGAAPSDPTPERSLGELRTMQAAGEAATGRRPAGTGAALAERYTVMDEVGRGGFAQVWKAKDRKLDRIVAVKRLLEDKLDGPGGRQTIERFEREATAIAQLNHRNIVMVFDHDTDADGHYIVMEYVEGGTLRDYLKNRGGRLPVPEAIELVKGIAQGLGYAHRKNLVHRDIKPANILLHREGGEVIPKITDFGLARLGSESELSLSGFGMGTPWYMPPEQRRNAKGVNHTADIYALGKTLYELVSGETPDNVDPDKVPEPWFTAVILKCIKSSPEERYFSCDDLLQALDAGLKKGSPKVATQTVGKESGNACPSCGAQNAADVKFCEGCGVGMTRICPECQRENSINKQYCGGCGTEVDGFSRVREVLDRMERYATEKRWSRVLKEEGLLAEKPYRLPGTKGQTMMARAAEMKQQADQAQKKCASLKKSVEQHMAQGDLASAARDATAYLDVDPYDADMIAHAEKAGRVVESVQETLTRAKGLLHKDNAAALELCLEALNLAPGDIQAQEFEFRIQEAQEKAIGLRQQAEEALINNRPDMSLDLWNQAEDYDANTGDEDLANRIAAAVQAVETDLRDAKKALKSGNLKQAEHLARLVLDQQTVSVEAKTILKTCQKAPRRRRMIISAIIASAVLAIVSVAGVGLCNLKRQTKISEALSSARQAKTSQQWEAVWQHASQALALDAGNADAIALKAEAEPNLGPSEGTAWTSKSMGMEFVWVPALKIWVGKYEVTNDEYRKKEPSHDSKEYKGQRLNGDNYPVVFVSFDDAKAYAAWLTERDKAQLSGLSYRVPSEAEWQAFAQCGGKREYPWGNAMPPKYGNYSDSTSAISTKIDGYTDGYAVTCPVEKSGVNDWGLYGVGGNVWEVCATATSGSSFGAWRGASWYDDNPDYLRCAFRRDFDGARRDINYGFRLVLSRLTAEKEEKRKQQANDAIVEEKRKQDALAAEQERLKAETIKVADDRKRLENEKAAPAETSRIERERKAKEEQEQIRKTNPKAPAEGEARTVGWLGMTLMPVAAGSFQMGSGSNWDEQPVHTVQIAKSYWMGRTEVTQKQWREVMGKLKYDDLPVVKGDDLPVVKVDWARCMEFCKKLTERERSAGRLPSGYAYRLPTEAEWEYAARGGAKSKGYKYSGGNDIDTVGWCRYNSGSTTHPVAQKMANELGLYDMSGNVWEWCLDDWHDTYAGAPSDGARWGDGTGEACVFRGGSWEHDGEYCCRSASRCSGKPSDKDWDGSQGLRVVLAAVP